MFKKVKLTQEQDQAMQVARIGLMNTCPFFCYYFYSEMSEHPTEDIPTAATDGRRIYYNPKYLASLKPPERIFALAHEIHHAIDRHPSRFKYYRNEAGQIRGLPFDHEFANECADYVINAALTEENVGMCNSAWLYDPAIKGSDLVEDVYEKRWKQNPPQGGAGGQSKPCNGGQGGQSTYGQHRRTGGKPDQQAQGNGGKFDTVIDPQVDPVSGAEDLPSEAEFKEAIAKAAAAAKAMGNMPANFQRMVEEILQPQINWREHVRMLLTGKLGFRHETWDRPNRRRLVLNPLVIMPGRRGYGADTVVVGVDTSGSIGEKELSAFFAEIGGVLQDVKPKRIVLIACDAAVQQVEELRSLDEAARVRATGVKGGGGTSFVPVFEYVAEEQIKPEALIYLTDLMGVFPEEAPGYPVIWAATTEAEVPFGEVVRIKL